MKGTSDAILRVTCSHFWLMVVEDSEVYIHVAGHSKCCMHNVACITRQHKRANVNWKVKLDKMSE